MRKISRKNAGFFNPADGLLNMGVPSGNFMFRQEKRVTLFRGSQKQPLIFVPFPQPDNDEPNDILMSSRLNADPIRGFSPWIVTAPVADFVGLEDKVSFVLANPLTYDRRTNPYNMLVDRCAEAHDKGKFLTDGRAWKAEWNGFVSKAKGSKTDRPALPRPKWLWFIQGLIYSCEQEQYVGTSKRDIPYGLADDDGLPIVVLSSTTGQELLRLLGTYAEQSEVKDEEFGQFKWPHPAGYFDAKKKVLRDGVFFHVFYPNNRDDELVRRYQVDSTWQDIDDDDQSFVSYKVAIRKKYGFRGKTYEPNFDQKMTRKILDRVEFWFDDTTMPDNPEAYGVIRVMSDEEMVELLAKVFRTVPQLILSAFAGTDWLTDSVTGLLTGRKTFLPPEEEDFEDYGEEEYSPPKAKKAPVAPPVFEEEEREDRSKRPPEKLRKSPEVKGVFDVDDDEDEVFDVKKSRMETENSTRKGTETKQKAVAEIEDHTEKEEEDAEEMESSQTQTVSSATSLEEDELDEENDEVFEEENFEEEELEEEADEEEEEEVVEKPLKIKRPQR